jgi:hypothetical protein
MKPKVCLETTIPSYLTSRPSRDLLVAAHQQLISDWWNGHRHRFSLFISVRVLLEAGAGDASAAALRLAELAGLPQLEFTPEALDLARRFLAESAIPAKSLEDAIHIAIATVNGMDYLLTWNCRHIVNAEIMKHLARIAEDAGYSLLLIARPLHARAIDGTLKPC